MPRSLAPHDALASIRWIVEDMKPHPWVHYEAYVKRTGLLVTASKVSSAPQGAPLVWYMAVWASTEQQAMDLERYVEDLFEEDGRDDKRCQKAAWPIHKKICKQNQESYALAETSSDELFKALHEFRRTHELVMIDAAKEREDVVVINLRPRPNAQHVRPETRFYVTDAQLETLSSSATLFEWDIEMMRTRLQACRELMSKGYGPCGSLFVVAHVVGFDISEIMTPAFLLDKPGYLKSAWKEYLFHMLNEGGVNVG
ncbi:uncharacterized protein B0H18DRAFT_1120335 [Fomitopsis serialis]|uniref:uncharacterized protein n=1 Tax=Fomitopsis serialis TaxID=139415 RepID=UPI00200804DC|nr:uncharacterized protein B0H18DRAFT_1120335 [Neoantrodia serialis]KAH9923690.1 hypothetical protein B0H18DRAFT_1120335 [Neoantrodia serialis]